MVNINTIQILREKYGDRYVHLDIIAKEYYGVEDAKTIGRMVVKDEFTGIRPFRARNSNKAPYLVDITQLAEALDRRAIEARK